MLRARTFAEYDRWFTAPLNGFADERDYWTRASSGPYLARIRRPTLLINAANDPFLPGEHLPSTAVVARSRWLEADFVPEGGHVGFLDGALATRRGRSGALSAFLGAFCYHDRLVLRDAYGLSVSTLSRAAVDAYDDGVRALLGFGAATVDSFRRAVDADPDFALARAALAVALYLDEQIPAARPETGAGDRGRHRAGRVAHRARAPAPRGPAALRGWARQRCDRGDAGDPGRLPA